MASLQFALFAVIVGVVAAAPSPNSRVSSSQQDVVVLKETSLNSDGQGGYNFAYELSDGQSRQESAYLVNVVGAETPTLRVSGSFGWTDPATNQQYVVRYVADEYGFRPEGDHLPLLPTA